METKKKSKKNTSAVILNLKTKNSLNIMLNKAREASGNHKISASQLIDFSLENMTNQNIEDFANSNKTIQKEISDTKKILKEKGIKMTDEEFQKAMLASFLKDIDGPTAVEQNQ